MKITILSCGWLGLPLGKFLAENGHKIKGATTTESKIESLRNAGISPYLMNLKPNLACENFEELVDSEIIIINIPPRISKNGPDFHISQIQSLVEGILSKYSVNSMPPSEHYPKIIFISSTSVYPNNFQIATEISEIDEDSVLIKAENLLKKAFKNITILRLGGLMGYDRFPAKYYIGKPIENWSTRVNYIHQDDAIQIISQIIELKIWNETFNVCSPLHPSRKEVLVKNCDDFGLELPIFKKPNSEISFKIISSEKLILATDFQFKYPNPLNFFYHTKGIITS